MKKFFKVISLLTIMTMVFSASFAFAANSEKPMNFSSKSELKDYAKNDSVNIMLYDENNKIINEYHSDGNEVSYEYENGKMKKSVDSLGGMQEYEQNGDSIIVKTYKDNKLMHIHATAKGNPNSPSLSREEKGRLADEKIKKYVETMKGKDGIQMSSTAYEDYYINGVLMNDIAKSGPNYSPDYFHAYDVMTESEIQNFFVSKNSILKDLVRIWKKNSSGTVYDTGTSITPSTAIYNAQYNNWCSAKVIIATLQKESSLVGSAPGTVSYSSRRFYYAMGYGATDGGDINGTSGFDIQINKGAELLYNGWIAAPYTMPVKMTVNNGVDKTSNGVTYKGYIWVKNWGTYSLYNYTPWTIDTSLLPTISGGNYLFYQIFNGYWGTDWT